MTGTADQARSRADDLGAVQVGQPQVEQHGVRGTPRCLDQGCLAGRRGRDLVAAGAQVYLQRAQQGRLVLDDEDAPGYQTGYFSSSARFSSSTLTTGSPRKPSVRPWCTA